MTLEITTTSYYRVGGNLPPDAPSYVKREADEQLYQKLKEGEFCYVLNSRQMGKSSLWVRVKQRLEQENYLCAAIDLSGIGQGDKNQWYTSFANRLTKSFAPSVKKQWRSWWKEQIELAPIEKLHQLIEELLLPSLLSYQKLVIFIDEIDYVKGLPFSTDEFFALIRSCYNERSLNPLFNQVTFCLLGVATPADLIENKQLTPFNIGTGVELQGFCKDEAEPLIAGLKGTVSYPESVMSDILFWTGGQPFLTQRLCSLVLFENNPTPDIPELVQRQIINNWETQDEQEHLRTIQNRILSNEQRAGYLLELYRKVLKQGQVPLNNSSEERELQLSGLVVKRGSVLEIYNPIYAKVFNESWLDSELEKLRPYAENYRAWLQSNKTDGSRLLHGQALKDAEAWALGKNLGGEDRDFLGASRAKEREAEIANFEKEILTLAYQKAQKRISFGTGVLIVTGLVATCLVVIGGHRVIQAENQLSEIKQQTEKVDRLSELSGELHKNGLASEASQAREYIGLSYEIKDHEFKQAFLLASISLACQKLDHNSCNSEPRAITESLELLEKQENLYTEPIGAQVGVFAYYIQGQLFNKQDKPNKAIKSYTKAFQLLQKSSYNPYKQNIPTQILSEEDVENIHYQLIKSQAIDINDKSDEIAISFRKHLYDGLKDLLDKDLLQEADQKTWEIMLYMADRWEQRYFTVESLQNFSCLALREIDQRWYDYPKRPKHFGFRVQKEIWQEAGSPTINSPKEIWRKFYIEVGWKTRMSGIESREGYVSYDNLGAFQDINLSRRGNLPYWGKPNYVEAYGDLEIQDVVFFSRDANCNL